MSTDNALKTEGEVLLDQARPSLLHFIAPAIALAIDIVVLASGAGSQTIWYLIRTSGVIAYVMLTLSVGAGLLLTNRVLPAGRSRVDAFEVHNFTALLVLGFVSVHVVALLLDTFIGFSAVNVLVPFTSDYRPVAVAGGILALYVTGIVYGSLWLRKLIGYQTWRTLHYASFAAFALAAAHGIFSGADSGKSWMVATYAVSLVIVACLTLRRVLTATAGKRLKAA